MAGLLRVTIDGRSVTLGPGERVVVGRHPESGLVVDHHLVSRSHLEVAEEAGRWVARDLGSANGTFVAGRPVPAVGIDGDVLVNLGDPVSGVLISLRPGPLADDGSASGPASIATEPVGSNGPATGERPSAGVDGRPSTGGKVAGGRDLRPLRVHALGPRVRIGRADDNDVVLNDLEASRHHAELRQRADGGYDVVDLDSHNGTYVAGERVEGVASVDDRPIEIGSRLLRVSPAGLEEHAPTEQFPVVAEGLRVVTPDGAVLLDDVGFVLEEASMVAVLGPSGAGKSTLLGALTGQRPATAGRVLVAGRELVAGDETLSRRIGYVPQDDLVQPELTVAQSLDYAARLRFPPDVGAAERDERVQEVMAELGLTHRSHVRVGALSGGQRKRVSIALELLTRPSLIFLDEPTSGLDPGYERSVMMALRRLADSGRTVVLVTHSVESLHLCDRVLCLAPGGKVAWFGPPEETAGHFGRPSYQEIFQLLDAHGARDHAATGGVDADAVGPDEWVARFAASDAGRRYVAEPLATHRHALDVPDEQATSDRPGRSLRGWVRQLSTLTARYARIVVSDRRTLTILVVTAPVLGLVLALRLPPDQLGTVAEAPLFSQAPLVLFIVVMGITQVATSTAVREIVKERAIFARERSVGLSASAYVLSKIFVLGALAVVQAAIIVGLGTIRQGGPIDGLVLGSGRIEMVLVGALAGLGAMALGLLVSAVVSSPDRVALVLPAVLGFHLVVTSGEVMPGTPQVPVIEQARYASTARWGLAAMSATVDVEDRTVANRAVGRYADLSADELAEISDADLRREVPVPPDLAHERSAWVRDVSALAGITVVLVGATIAVLRRRPRT